MTPEDLQRLIDQVNEQTPKEGARFGLFRYGASEEVFYIRGNKEGLALFAAELLKVAVAKHDVDSEGETALIPILFQESWVVDEADVFLQFVKLENKPSLPVQLHPKKRTVANMLAPVGCFGVMIVLVVALAVGLWTLVKWLFA